MGLPQVDPYPLPSNAELPPSSAPWQLDASRAALLIHDVQNYFVDVFRRDASPIADALANMGKLRDACDARGVPVFYTAQPGNQDRRDRGLQADLWGAGMDDTPEQQAIVDVLAPRPDHVVLTKWRYSAFQRTTLEPMLRARGRDQLIICGVYAHIGCLLSAADAFMRDIEPFFVADALGDFSRERHDMALAYAAGRCAVVASTATVLAGLA